MARRKVEGICHICGEFGKLTYEHVPPKAAFNDRKIMEPTFEQFSIKGPGEYENYDGFVKENQKGAGGFTLCSQCNNDTGSYYGSDFVDFTYDAMNLLHKSNGDGKLFYQFHTFPLRVIKQVITMFFSTNGPDFRTKNQELVSFVLNPEKKYLDPSIRIFAYLTNSSLMRKTGISVKGSSDNGRVTSCVLSEISFPPMGYVMTFDSEPPDHRLFEITHFSRYGFNDFTSVYLKLHKLPVEYYLPADFRSVEEIKEDYRRNTGIEI